jgi:amino acid transporter
MERVPWFAKIRNIVMGGPRNVQDKNIFHKLSLIAFFAWVGLGADGLSSSCYGPQEAFLALNGHTYLSIFVAIGTVLTIFIISSSYSQIVELFPHGGGGYLVASKLLSPTLGMISGCALLIDYVLTITVSVASGADAIFSFLPAAWYGYRLEFAILIVMILIYLNMRGVKESVIPLMPIFLTFIATHVFIIIYALVKHASNMPDLAVSTVRDTQATISQVGVFGLLFLVLRAYSMGAGTFTGIEAVSNGVPVLREPKVQTAKHTMRYMAISLSFMVLGLMIAYLLFQIKPVTGKTLNAILLESVTGGWKWGSLFVFVALISEGMLLFVAAQTGFLDGPRVLANMAADRWFPTRFSSLSDRLVIKKGILIMGGLAALLMVMTRASVKFLVVLYSINVFITFVLSQTGMVRHWWNYRKKAKKWLRKILVNGVGLVLSFFILVSMIIMKFSEGGWITLFITSILVILAILTKRHYYEISKQLRRLNSLVRSVELQEGKSSIGSGSVPKYDPKAKTAVLLVNGFNGIGLHTLFGVIRLFSGVFKNFVFLEVGMVDAGNFKGVTEMENLKIQVDLDLNRYVNFMNQEGYYAEGISVIGVDVIDQVDQITPAVVERFPNAVFFGGQLLFTKDSFFAPLFHNYAVFSIQKKLYRQGVPFVILPIRV